MGENEDRRKGDERARGGRPTNISAKAALGDDKTVGADELEGDLICHDAAVPVGDVGEWSLEGGREGGREGGSVSETARRAGWF